MEIKFSVDAGIVNRLGKELVGRAETAVSELVKNSYDADATIVTLKFVDSDNFGGKLILLDNGAGMTKNQLINGFMRLSSTEKVHNPKSPKFNRIRAGRKGIGRFATQRLGAKLTIKTKSHDDIKGYKLEINWDDYESDKELGNISNQLTEVDLEFDSGTELVISELREAWLEPQIKRVFRYISDLLQPSSLSDLSRMNLIGLEENKNAFNVYFYKIKDGLSEVIIDQSKMYFDHALGVFEGYVIDGKGICEVRSERFQVNDIIEIEGDFSTLKEIHFKAYYFIYNYRWYKSILPKVDFNFIANLSESHSGIKLYRNGFRVLPYGEKGNDWLKIDKSSVKTSQNAYVPFNNNNFFGFVEIFDSEGKDFEETSSREGLVENLSFEQLSVFLNRSLKSAAQRVNSARIALIEKEEKDGINLNETPIKERLEEFETNDEKLKDLIEDTLSELEEIEMLRVLASVGLIIGEFTHEIRQFVPSFNGNINYLSSLFSNNNEIQEILEDLKKSFLSFRSYTTYLDATIAQNVLREKEPLNLIKKIRDFIVVVSKDSASKNIELLFDFFGFDLYTIPMHPSELTSILYNLLTNSRKAINRANVKDGRIKIVLEKIENSLVIDFMDNGDGIPPENYDKIFNAFFTTSTSISEDFHSVSGTGLGLKIVKDILNGYSGNIVIYEPEAGFNTNFRITMPSASEKILKKYGL
ncbi:Signal transduction histidine kinase [Aquiflexum balticum DSM 16537]|uniref:histidine kinase n=1 Tax=Aquiflexum balticum DSM 16537 TaxID=758820 RepID=A0A1W2H0G4_9BACT|nr:sensor histidine kinase [Aquiflexum balticum]SMD42425.1 Signal transduction histidine kinase [Aquiflexum balticum DSM 16537]